VHFTVAQQQCRYHGRVNPLHDQICTENGIKAVGSLCFEQFRAKLIIKEVVAATLFLRLKDVFVGVFDSAFNHFVDLGTILAKVLQAPDAFEQLFELLCDLLAFASHHFIQHCLIRKALLELLEG